MAHGGQEICLRLIRPLGFRQCEAAALFRVHALGDVDHRRLDRRIALPSDDMKPGLEAYFRSIPLHALDFVCFRGRLASRHAILPILGDPFALLRLVEGCQGPERQDIVGFVIAEDVGVSLIGEKGDAVTINDDSLDRSLDQASVLFLAFPERVLSLLPVTGLKGMGYEIGKGAGVGDFVWRPMADRPDMFLTDDANGLAIKVNRRIQHRGNPERR